MSKRRHDLDEYLDVEKRSRQDLSYLFHIPPTPPDAPQEQCPGLKMDLYPHQKRSLKRMMDLEDSPKLDGLGTFRDLTTMGGVVADTVGMGKTAEVIALCVRRGGVSTSKPRDGAINVKANFVVCPSHLCGSWKTEVDKFTDLAAVVANGATSQKVVTEVDFVILPLEALVAPDSKQIYFWRSFVFRRCVFDECHDAVFLDGAAMAIFQSLQSDNVWAVSGTPFPHHDSSILAINQLLRIRLRINLTQTPFAFTTKRKLPQSDVFTRLKELIYIRNTPETASAELVAAVPSPFPIAEGQGERSAPSTLGPGYTEDVFYIDLCDVERALYRDEAWRSGYMAPSGDESADPWHSRFTKLRMFCSAPLVGSLAAEAELEGEEVELAPLVDGSHQRGKQESLFRLTLEQLRVGVFTSLGNQAPDLCAGPRRPRTRQGNPARRDDQEEPAGGDSLCPEHPRPLPVHPQDEGPRPRPRPRRPARPCKGLPDHGARPDGRQVRLGDLLFLRAGQVVGPRAPAGGPGPRDEADGEVRTRLRGGRGQARQGGGGALEAKGLLRRNRGQGAGHAGHAAHRGGVVVAGGRRGIFVPAVVAGGCGGSAFGASGAGIVNCAAHAVVAGERGDRDSELGRARRGRREGEPAGGVVFRPDGPRQVRRGFDEACWRTAWAGGRPGDLPHLLRRPAGGRRRTVRALLLPALPGPVDHFERNLPHLPQGDRQGAGRDLHDPRDGAASAQAGRQARDQARGAH
ncbi:SNF2 family N-terminal domain-containing protein [Hyaloraphidium curvatum]|nr:SNF2 family N-terminal domain-containing protein [Hyaloraphidium curvatum]